MNARTVAPLVATAVAVVALTLPTPAAAQGSNRDVFVAGAAGVDGSTSGNYDGGPELGGFVELGLARHAVGLRGEVGVGIGDLDAPGAGVPGTVRRIRIAGSVIKTFGPGRQRRGLIAFLGGGAGAYLYRASGRSNGVAPSVHGLGGVEYRLPHAGLRWSVGAEAQFQRVGAPEEPHAVGWLNVIRVGGFVKFRVKSA